MSHCGSRVCADLKKAKFLNFRHAGASHIAQRGRDPRHLLAVVKMMGDTRLATVNRHSSTWRTI
jgi:hypothetical protein